MSYLKEIKDFVQTLSIALANSLEIQISILDETLEQIGGTGPYKASVGTSTNKYGLMHKAMLTRELYYVENPREDKKCYGCTMKERCIETASVGYPIIMNDEVIGAIGLNCFSNEERKRLLEKKEFLLKFLESMSELIAAKVKENISIQKIKEQNIQFKEILDFVTDGIIILDKKGKIKNINKNAEKIFNTDLEEAFLERNGLTKNFDDMGTEEERKEIVEVLENKTIRDIIDDYLQYHGHGLYSSDLSYLLIELLDLDFADIKSLGEC